jgi:predicted GIY-YIG superfamily endonuclease
MFTVYILRCADGTLYTGCTNDLEGRVRKHNSGKGAKYTRPRRPVAVVHTERRATKGAAMKREAQIKALTRSEKEALVGAGPMPSRSCCRARRRSRRR